VPLPLLPVVADELDGAVVAAVDAEPLLEVELELVVDVFRAVVDDVLAVDDAAT
jgi:hypothetical protein